MQQDHAPAPRVVTLIASATEIVAALGFADHLVGISHECDYPPEVLHLPRLSAPKVDPADTSSEIDRSVREILRDGLSVYRVDVGQLERLRPDVIVTQDQCEVCAVSLADVERCLAALDLPNARVCSLHPEDLEDVRADMRRVAGALGARERGERLVQDFDDRLRGVAQRTAALGQRPTVVLLEWLAPPMVAGGWMPELARTAGAEPLIVDQPRRFSQVGWDDLAAADPNWVVVHPCGFGVPRTLHELRDPVVAEGIRRIRAVREGRCRVLDGNAYFNRPGPRLADSTELLASVLNPELFADSRHMYADAVASWP